MSFISNITKRILSIFKGIIIVPVTSNVNCLVKNAYVFKNAKTNEMNYVVQLEDYEPIDNSKPISATNRKFVLSDVFLQNPEYYDAFRQFVGKSVTFSADVSKVNYKRYISVLEPPRLSNK